MANYFPQRKSIRYPGWDYRWAGAYFITICTQDQEHYFGKIKEGKMYLSPAGAIADVLWQEIKHHTTNVNLGAFVVMPNHIHGILILDGTFPESMPKIPNRVVNEYMSSISPKAGSVSTIIRSYKSAVKKHCNRLELPMEWHSKFYDHIIRNEKSYYYISNYIINNPKKWEEDRFCK